jgi:TPR repeat protein
MNTKQITSIVGLLAILVVGNQVMKHWASPGSYTKTQNTQIAENPPTATTQQVPITKPNPAEAFRRGLEYETAQPPDYTNAIVCYKQAYIYPPAMRELGALYLTGLGGETNLDLAKQLLLVAAQNNDATAQGLLAGSYLYGPFPKTVNQAIYWAQKGAANGDAQAQYVLGLAFLQGEGMPMDINNAYKLIYQSNQQAPNNDKQQILNDLANQIPATTLTILRASVGPTPNPITK